MRPMVGVISRHIVEESKPWYPTRMGVVRTYIDAVSAAGGVPVIVPLLDDSKAMHQIYSGLDGLVFAGGGDVNPTFYGEDSKRELDRPDITQDKIELTLASWAVLDRKPVLGICRGMQVMNVALGGSLHQDLYDAYDTKINHDESFQNHDFARLVHDILIEDDSRLFDLLNRKRVTVNSMHHQSLKRVASDLVVSALAEDGVIEAVEGVTDHYVVGIQAHPEVLVGSEAPWINLFQDFLKNCTKKEGVKA